LLNFKFRSENLSLIINIKIYKILLYYYRNKMYIKRRNFANIFKIHPLKGGVQYIKKEKLNEIKVLEIKKANSQSLANKLS